jgi:hypothetical protein
VKETEAGDEKVLYREEKDTLSNLDLDNKWVRTVNEKQL